MGAIEEVEKAGRLVLVGAFAGLGDWGGAEVTPSISPTCSGADMKPSSARSLAAGMVDWRACLHIVMVGGTG